MPTRATRPRLPGGAALLVVPAAALFVHQVRYSLAYGSHAGTELALQGHSYLHSLVPWTIAALGLGFASFIRRAMLARATGDPGPFTRLGPTALWLLTTTGLIALYALQEGLEEIFATGHPGGVAGIFGHGGWWALPAAAVAALAVVAILRAGRALLRVAASAPRGRIQLSLAPVLVAATEPVRIAPLARSAAGRAPPPSRRRR